MCLLPIHARVLAATLLSLWVSGLAHAQEVDAHIALELDAAMDLAVRSQPLIAAQAAQARSARESAVAASQLPDPTLTGMLSDLPVSGPDRFSLHRDGDTQLVVGLRQAFPGGAKRALRGERGEREAARLEAEGAELQRMVRREAGLAWLETWKAIEAQAIVKAAQADARRQLDAADIAYRNGRGQQADLIAARIALELLADQRASLEQQEWHARNQLRRWIGEAAERPLCPDLPAYAAPDVARLLAQLETHPHVEAQARAVEAAAAGLALAREESRPDWSVQVGYGYRPEFADYASLGFEIGLPVFPRNRQDRGIAAKSAEVEAASASREDWLRRHRAAIRLDAQDWERLQARLRRYDEPILPDAARRVEAALASYGAGSGPLVGVLDARRALQDIRLQRLELQLDAARHQVNLQYFAAGKPSS